MSPPVYIRGKASKEPDRRARNRLRMAVSRFSAHVWTQNPSDEALPAFGFVADLSDTGAGLFIGENLPKGSHIYVAFEQNKSETFKSIVMWCNRYTLEQHFLGHKALNFRVGIKFLFGSEADRQKFLTFFEGVKTRHLLTDDTSGGDPK